MLKKIIYLSIILLFSGCGTSTDYSFKKVNEATNSNTTKSTDNSSKNSTDNNSTNSQNNRDNNDSKDLPYSYKGLQFYYEDLPLSSYRLEQLSDSEFNSLNTTAKLQVADKLLNSLFFGYSYKELKEKIESGSFISSIKDLLSENKIDKEALENLILNDDYFKQYKDKTWAQPQVINILTRFYAMDKLDKYYLENWVAYILTQTIMFSPAYELSSTHTPDISRVYNRLVNMLDINSGMRYITYVHMMSQDNWRRFRSPEDNGREMLEIYTLDTKDSHVPLAAKALQNWRLNTDSDTLEVGLNKNYTPIKLFNTTIYTGEDFYRELVKSDAFTYGVTKRLVDFFFPQKSESKRDEIAKTITSSNPQKWQDILLQILFSKEYLLNNQRALSAEERFYSFAKKLKFKVKRDAFYYFKSKLSTMHQASMKYKLGKLDRVPLDSLSFATYHKYVREYILLNMAYKDEADRDSWKYDGWSEDILSTNNFTLDLSSDEATLKSFIKYLFLITISREPNKSEYDLFIGYMLDNGKFKSEFNIVTRRDTNEEEERLKRREYIARVVFDYISRLEETYMQKEVK